MASLKRIDADSKASSLPDSATAHRPASPAEQPVHQPRQRSAGQQSHHYRQDRAICLFTPWTGENHAQYRRYQAHIG